MIFFRRSPVRRVRAGVYQVNLSAEERRLLRDLPRQLRDLLAQTDDPALRRLFPPAYVDDPEGEAEYRRLMGDDLLQGRQAALETMAASIDQPELDEEQVTAWLSSLNDLRLVLGTQLDIQEDDDPQNTPAHQLYYYLTMLEDSVIVAMASQFE
ncbi:MAG TPA: DUF2017 family protein [Acidimicrobiales bacterium]|jgi:hypothetical protein|nr:DUF2017 family protein [Acidimicrobiales bacterium]